MQRSLVVLVVLSALLVLCPPCAATADEGPELLSREYGTRYLSRSGLETLLWDACPQPDAGACVVYDTRIKGGAVRLVAPPEVHRTVSNRLLELERRSDTRLVRLDLVAARPGSTEDLAALPATVRAALDPLRPQLDGAGLVHVDSAVLTVRHAASAYFADGERAFRADLSIDRRGDTEVALRLPRAFGDEDLPGTLLATDFVLRPGHTHVAGTTRYATDGPQLILLLTPES
jgi:hypothetical protein